MVFLVSIAAPIVAIRETRLRKSAQFREAQARIAVIRETDAREETRRRLYVADMNVAQQAWEIGDVKRVSKLPLRRTGR